MQNYQERIASGGSAVGMGFQQAGSHRRPQTCVDLIYALIAALTYTIFIDSTVLNQHHDASTRDELSK